jgi:hypothetical protein
MRQATEIKQETRQINLSVTDMLHDRKGELTGLGSFCGIENAQAVSPRGVLLAANALSRRSSLSRNLAGRPATRAKRSLMRGASLPLSKSFSAEAHAVNSASCVLSDVLATAIAAGASRAKADKQQNRYSIVSQPRDGVTSRMPTQPRAPRGLVSHTLINVTARSSVACGPKTNCCGTAVSSQI